MRVCGETMEFVINLSTIIAVILSVVIGGTLTYTVISGKDKIAVSILNACNFLMDEYGEDVKEKNFGLYMKLVDALERMEALATGEGYSLWEYFTLMRDVPGIFKEVMDMYEVDDWVKEAMEKVK